MALQPHRMNKLHVSSIIAAAMAGLLSGSGANAQSVSVKPSAQPAAEPTLIGQIMAGKPILEIRARYEHDDQTKTATLRNNAEGTTVRTRLGWETAAYRNVKALVEIDDVRRVGPEHFAITTNGAAVPLNGADKARYPAINDPDVTELNRAQLVWTPNKVLAVTAGRQRIQLDDQRFIGASGWRQDEQTYDALRGDLSLGRFKGIYVYVSHINRTLGERRDWDSDSHFLNLGWTASDALKVVGFVYALDTSDSPINTSLTKGVRASGKAKAGPYGLAYNGTFVHQSDYHGATADYGLDYYGWDLSASRDIYTVKFGFDALEGNGVRGFGAPLSAAHTFNGWADAWSSAGGNKSFAEGLNDANLTVNVKPRVKSRWFSKPELMVRYHDFESRRTGGELGHEWNMLMSAALTPKISAQWKYADFERVKSVPVGTLAPPASRTKMWFTLEYKL